MPSRRDLVSALGWSQPEEYQRALQLKNLMIVAVRLDGVVKLL